MDFEDSFPSFSDDEFLKLPWLSILLRVVDYEDYRRRCISCNFKIFTFCIVYHYQRSILLLGILQDRWWSFLILTIKDDDHEVVVVPIIDDGFIMGKMQRPPSPVILLLLFLLICQIAPFFMPVLFLSLQKQGGKITTTKWLLEPPKTRGENNNNKMTACCTTGQATRDIPKVYILVTYEDKWYTPSTPRTLLNKQIPIYWALLYLYIINLRRRYDERRKARR